eukprot:TRINITY_DN38958_c0_g2_i1.p1 TRINITY_DN38958_c0_g2~~TRINITY_DN38958_c0_g2_i1.p1  ORF type:complete len:211 (-),score=27.27 TRINITY_DN38958_c0_g2_i1:349-981(-)
MGDLNRTVVIVSSDHGEELGDHDRFDKMLHWDGSSRVPLVVHGPGVASGKVSNLPVAVLDIGGTLLDFAGAPLATNMSTGSLRPLLDSKRPADGIRSFVASGLTRVRPGEPHKNWRMVVRRVNATSVLKFVCCPTGCVGSKEAIGKAEAFLFDVHRRRGEAGGFASDVIASGRREAAHLSSLLPPKFRDACAPLVGDTNMRTTAADLQFI